MGETQSVMLSSFGGTWPWGNSTSAARASSPTAEGTVARAEASNPRAPDAATTTGGGRGDFESFLSEAVAVSRLETREYASYRLSRGSFMRTPITWNVGRTNTRFDFGVSLRSRRASTSPERASAAVPEAVQKEAHECQENSRDTTPATASQDATSTPDGPAEREFICSVCLELLWKPTVLDCGHSFCFWCAYQCMNLYDVSHCPLCKRSFDKFPPVSRPLNLFLLRHFPRTTKQRDKEMEEFESSRHRRSPCHSRIADLASGASTDALPAPQLHLLLEQKAPDLVRPAAAIKGAKTGSVEIGRQQEKPQSGPSGSAVRRTLPRQDEDASSCPTMQTGGEPGGETQPSRGLDVQRMVFRPANASLTEGGERSRVSRSAEIAETGQEETVESRRRFGGNRVCSQAYAENFVFSNERTNTAGPRNRDLSAPHTRRHEATRTWNSDAALIHLPSISGTGETRSVLRFEPPEGSAVSTPLASDNYGWRAAVGASTGTRDLPLEYDESPTRSSYQRRRWTPHTLRSAGLPAFDLEEDMGAVTLDSHRRTGVSAERTADSHAHLSIPATTPSSSSRSAQLTSMPQRPEGSPCFERPAEETCQRRTAEETENTDDRQLRSASGSDGSVMPRGSTTLTLESPVGEWDEGEGLDEGDISLGVINPGELVSGHRRNPGDEPLQPMDVEEEEISGYVDVLVEDAGVSGDFRTTSAVSVVTERDPIPHSDADDEYIRAVEEEIQREIHDTEEHIASLEEFAAFSGILLTPEDFVHYGIHCDGCGKMPIIGRRHRCLDCSKEACGFDLCGTCKDAGYDKPGRFDQNHSKKHKMKLVQPQDAEWWIQSLNRMKKIHPELTMKWAHKKSTSRDVIMPPLGRKSV